MKKFIVIFVSCLCILFLACHLSKKSEKEIEIAETSSETAPSTTPPPTSNGKVRGNNTVAGPPPEPTTSTQPTTSTRPPTPTVSPVHTEQIKTRSIKRIKKSSNKEKHASGLLVYNIPDSLECRKWYMIKFRVNRDIDDTITISSKLENISVQGIKVGDVMNVTLTDPREVFTIKKINEEKQFVDTIGYTEWTFNICPLKPGNHSLYLVVSVIQNGTQKDLVYDKNIQVTSKLSNMIAFKSKTFFEKYWQWLISTLLLPLFYWLWNRKKKKNLE